MKEDCVIWPETDRPLGIVQQKPQNDKRARRRYRCDPLGHVCQYAPGADLALPCLASLLELQDVATLGSETSGLEGKLRLQSVPDVGGERHGRGLYIGLQLLGIEAANGIAVNTFLLQAELDREL